MNPLFIKKIVRNALIEDRARADITSQLLISRNHQSKAEIIFCEPGVVCGIKIAKEVFHALDPNVKFKSFYKDGDVIKKNTCVASISGLTQKMLAGERTALNFLGYLSGIATQTREYVLAVGKNPAIILATRKTTPGNRQIEKYAVITGGGMPHRNNLEEMVLIKDNHHLAFNSQTSLADITKNHRKRSSTPIEIEVETLDEFDSALKAEPDFILLDNMTLNQVRKAVQKARKIPKNKRPLLEASGGITLKTIGSIAQTGVERISVGALTHSHRFINVSMEFIVK